MLPAPPPPSTEAVDPARMERAKALVAPNHCNFCHAANFAVRSKSRALPVSARLSPEALRDLQIRSASPATSRPWANVVQPMKDEGFPSSWRYYWPG